MKMLTLEDRKELERMWSEDAANIDYLSMMSGIDLPDAE